MRSVKCFFLLCLFTLNTLWLLNRQMRWLGGPPGSTVTLGPVDVAFFHQTNVLNSRTNASIRSVRDHMPRAPYYLLSDGGPDFSGAARDFNVSTFRADGMHLTRSLNQNFTCQAHLQRFAEAARWASRQGATFLIIWEDDTRLLKPLRTAQDVDLNTMGNVGNLHVAVWNPELRQKLETTPRNQLAPGDAWSLKDFFLTSPSPRP